MFFTGGGYNFYFLPVRAFMAQLARALAFCAVAAAASHVDDRCVKVSTPSGDYAVNTAVLQSALDAASIEGAKTCEED